MDRRSFMDTVTQGITRTWSVWALLPGLALWSCGSDDSGTGAAGGLPPVRMGQLPRA